MIAFDVDGVLASKPSRGTDKKWGRMNGAERKAYKEHLLKEYIMAEPLYRPTEPFVAISARKEEPLVREITEAWIFTHYGELCRFIFLLPTSRSVANVVAFKTEALRICNATEFTEDNKKVLRGIEASNLGIPLYFWERGMTERLAYNSITDKLRV